MNDFIKKNFMFIIIAVVLVLFVVLSILIKEEVSEEIKAWITETEKDEFVVTVVAQEKCGFCEQFKPIMNEVHDENDFELYWYEIDVIRKKNVADYNAILGTYNLEGYGGTPYTFITRNGKFVDYLSGSRDKDTLLEFLQTNGVITLND